MLDKNIDTYRSIRAPKELREKVLAKAEVRSRMPVRVLGLAASFVLCVAAVIAVLINSNSSDRISVSVFGTQISADPMPVGSADRIMPMSVSDQLERISIEVYEEDFEVTVSDGEFLRYGNTVVWNIVGADTDREYRMVITAQGSKYSVIITYDRECGSWMIYGK